VGITGYHAQRLLEIGRGDIGKLLQFFVGTLQFPHRLHQMLLGFLAFGDVSNGCRHQDSVSAFERAEHDLDGKLAAIFPPSSELNPVPICCASASAALRVPSAISRSAKPSGIMFFTLCPTSSSRRYPNCFSAWTFSKTISSRWSTTTIASGAASSNPRYLASD